MSLSFSSARRNSQVLFTEDTGQPSSFARRWISYPFYCFKWSSRPSQNYKKFEDLCFESSEIQTEDGKYAVIKFDVEFFEIIKEYQNKEYLKEQTVEDLLTEILYENISFLLPSFRLEELTASTVNFTNALFAKTKEKLSDSHLHVHAIDIIDVNESMVHKERSDIQNVGDELLDSKGQEQVEVNSDKNVEIRENTREADTDGGDQQTETTAHDDNDTTPSQESFSTPEGSFTNDYLHDIQDSVVIESEDSTDHNSIGKNTLLREEQEKNLILEIAKKLTVEPNHVDNSIILEETEYEIASEVTDSKNGEEIVNEGHDDDDVVDDESDAEFNDDFDVISDTEVGSLNV